MDTQARVVVSKTAALDWGLAVRMAVLLGLATFVPALGLPQQVTGPIVNALLFVAVGSVGITGAVLVGGVPSLVGIAQGTVPLPLIAMVPYIVAGNAVLAVTFGLLRRRGFALGAVVAAVLKFAFLYCAVTYVVRLPQPVATMMQLPQLYTALAGAVLAYGVVKGGAPALAWLKSRLGW